MLKRREHYIESKEVLRESLIGKHSTRVGFWKWGKLSNWASGLFGLSWLTTMGI